MDPPTCEVCGRPAGVFLTEIHDGNKVERRLCAQHASQSGHANLVGLAPGQLIVNGAVCSSPQDAAIRGVLDNLRGTVNFIKRRGRMPSSVQELREGMASPDGPPLVRIEDAELKKQVEYLDGLVTFLQVHGRMPQSPQDLPSAPGV